VLKNNDGYGKTIVARTVVIIGIVQESQKLNNGYGETVHQGTLGHGSAVLRLQSDEVSVIFNLPNSFSPFMALGSLTEVSIRKCFWE
jgi:hypothetical protein